MDNMIRHAAHQACCRLRRPTKKKNLRNDTRRPYSRFDALTPKRAQRFKLCYNTACVLIHVVDVTVYSVSVRFKVGHCPAPHRLSCTCCHWCVLFILKYKRPKDSIEDYSWSNCRPNHYAMYEAVSLLWPPIIMDKPLYFAAVVSIFLLLSSFFFLRLISVVGD